MIARKYDLEDRLVEFSSGIIDIVESMPSTRAGNYLAEQLIRCGLAPALHMVKLRALNHEMTSSIR
jgi:hypothetical protein